MARGEGEKGESQKLRGSWNPLRTKLKEGKSF
jgi:hypothetical protein